ncbi:hypothetical protein L6164_018347 [Bauhinia variegata]|uniref:Uncharacterized protein n=1 Tax=Bauhinia variegata TaxID=167791 RepID=A0ACB9NCZ3_BAUVA|nr:hypothetical protein L6164_018347 [Bauhinia variegata]
MSTNFGFPQFYNSWFDHLRHLVKQLTSLPRPPYTATDSHDLCVLIDKFMSHYNDLHCAKCLAAERDPLYVLVAPWATTFERSLHWIAGWRPTTAFHIVYTESSILFESRVIDILRGLRTGDLGDLSPSQFRRVSELQCETVKEENAITEELSEWQDSATELVGPGFDINEKIGLLVGIIKKADDLRLRTLRSVVGVLTPQQAVEFLIAAAELQFGIRGWGVNHDRPGSR